jgi:hypothetical protein
MRFSTPVLLSIFSALISKASAGCSYENGNYYCNEVSAIAYENVGYSGSYMDVTNMDESTCKCTQQSVSFSGSNSPLDEELSVHFRGPVKLLQFGVYKPSSSSSKKVKRDEEGCSTTKHIHHAHKRDAATAVVEVTQTVYVNGNGEVITGSTSTPSTPSTQATQSTTTLVGNTNVNSGNSVSYSAAQATLSTSSSSTTSSSTAAAASSSSSSGSTNSAWVRDSYYTPGSADNCVFLNTLGGTNSGTWSSCFGNSLSYASSDASSAVSSAVAMGEVLLKTDEEYVIFSGTSCSSGDGCGYYRSNIPAYHGFDGSEKIFVFEFEMPHEDNASGSNPDMPAIWLLNAKIPRTLQYGDSTCSCWSTGCGELDLFEILSQGDERLISHIHDGQGNDGTSYGGGGSQDYFARPTSGSMKAAVIFTGSAISIVKLDDTVSFSSGLDASTVNTWLSTSGSTAQMV